MTGSSPGIGEACLRGQVRRGRKYVIFLQQPEVKTKAKNPAQQYAQPEQILWCFLKGKNLGCKFRRQYSIGNYILDFYCPELRLAVEIDGDSHFIDDQAIIYYQKREEFLAKKNLKVIHFANSDVTKNIDAVIGKISEYLFEFLPPLAPSCSRGGNERAKFVSRN